MKLWFTLDRTVGLPKAAPAPHRQNAAPHRQKPSECFRVTVETMKTRIGFGTRRGMWHYNP